MLLPVTELHLVLETRSYAKIVRAVHSTVRIFTAEGPRTKGEFRNGINDAVDDGADDGSARRKKKQRKESIITFSASDYLNNDNNLSSHRF